MENGEIKDGFTSLSEMERLREQETVAMETGAFVYRGNLCQISRYRDKSKT